MGAVLKVVGALGAIGAAAFALTSLDGWDEFLDITGLREFEPKPVRLVPDSQCDQIESARGADVVVSCIEDRRWAEEVRAACAGKRGPSDVQRERTDFLLGVPGTTKITAPRCP